MFLLYIYNQSKGFKRDDMSFKIHSSKKIFRTQTAKHAVSTPETHVKPINDSTDRDQQQKKKKEQTFLETSPDNRPIIHNHHITEVDDSESRKRRHLQKIKEVISKRRKTLSDNNISEEEVFSSMELIAYGLEEKNEKLKTFIGYGETINLKDEILFEIE